MTSNPSPAGSRLETSDFVLRAQTDSKQYRLLTLQNGLEVLLVSDQQQRDGAEHEDDSEGGEDEEGDEDEGSDGVVSNESEQEESVGDEDGDDDDDHKQRSRGVGTCAAAMAVGVGSFHESFKLGHPHGLAHLLEHMLFMGSEKYPTENAYDDHLSKHGGYSNAYTEAENTVYYFEVPHPGLHQALDIFAQFFVAPLMLKDSLDREINAVDSEFDTVRGDDDLRLKAIWRLDTVTEDHPYARFCWGNTKSLRESGEKKDLRTYLTEFYAQHYCIENMKLAIWTNDELDVIEQVVKDSFGAIRKSTKTKGDAKPLATSLPFSSSTCLGHVHSIVPVNDCHILRLTWQHAPMKSYKSRPHAYVAHLLGHESKGGVLSYLKKMGWANDFWAGTSEDDGHENSSVCMLFSVEVKLTVSGMENYNKVISAIFAYLGMLNKLGPQRWVFDEVQKSSRAAFEFKDEGDPSGEACDLAVNLLPQSRIDDRKDILASDHLLFDFIEKDVTDLMDSLGISGDTAPRIDIASSKFGRAFQYANEETKGDTTSTADSKLNGVLEPTADMRNKFDKEEQHWGTRYCVERISDAQLKEFTAALENGAEHDPRMELALPPVNKYIPSSLKVHPLSPKRVAEDALQATHILLGSSVEVYTQVGKSKWLWLPANITNARTISLGAGTGAAEEGHEANEVIEIQARFELDTESIWLRDDQAGLTSAATPLGPSLYLFNEGRNKVRVLTPQVPRFPSLISPPGSDESSSSRVKLWWLQDGVFRVPRSGMYVALRCPHFTNAQDRALSELLCSVATNVLDHEAYLAKMAELDVHIKVQDEGFILSCFGFSEKLLDLVQKAMETLLRFVTFKFLPCKDDQERKTLIELFELERESIVRHLLNAENETDVQANNIRLRALVPGAFSKKQLAQELKALDIPLLLASKFSDELSRTLYDPRTSRIEVLYHGNVAQDDAELALKYFKSLVATGKGKGHSVPPPTRIPVVDIPKGTGLNVVVAPSEEPSEKTCALHLYYELGEDTAENQALGEMLESLMDEPLFDELRTKQQLGYVVSCGLRRTHGVLGFTIEITSSKFTPTECFKRYEAFLKDFREEELGCMTDAEMKKRTESAARRMLHKDTGIFQETKRHWSTIFEQTYRFNEKWIVAHEVVNAPKSGGRYGITVKALTEFFDLHFTELNRKCLLVLIVGGGSSDLTNVATEKQSLPNNSVLIEGAEELWVKYPNRFPVQHPFGDKALRSLNKNNKAPTKQSSKQVMATSATTSSAGATSENGKQKKKKKAN